LGFSSGEYSVLIFFVAAVAVLLGWAGGKQPNSSAYIALSFVLGAFCSALAGFIGMRVATKANVRTTHAARTGLGQALEVAFAGGSVMGMGVVGLGVLGLSGLFLVYSNMFGISEQNDVVRVITILTGFSFGASSIALFARVGGGIYTKAADVGADLVGKVEAGRLTPPQSPITSVTTWVTLRAWAPTCSSPMWVQLSEPWFWAPHSLVLKRFKAPAWAGFPR